MIMKPSVKPFTPLAGSAALASPTLRATPPPATGWRRKLKLGFTALLGAVAVMNASAATAPQPIGFAAGTKIEFTGLGRGVAPGYCLHELGKGAPAANAPLQAISGRVTLSYRDRPSRSMSLAEAFQSGELKTQGFRRNSQNGIFAATFIAAANVTSVAFDTHSAVGDNSVSVQGLSAPQRQAVIDHTFRYFDPAKSERANQQALWNAPLEWIEEVAATPGERVLRPVVFDPARHMQVRFLRLGSQADASLVVTPGGRAMLHDIGGSEEATLEMLQRIPLVNGQRRVAVVITHGDADHYRGLYSAMKKGKLKELGVVIDEVIIGVAEPVSKKGVLKNPAGYARSFVEFVELLLKNDFEEHPAFPHFARFVRKSVAPLRITQSLESVYFRQIDPAYPEIFKLDLEPGFDLRILRTAQPATMAGDRHAYNLVMQYQHQGTTVMDMGDASLAQIKEMIRVPGALEESWIKWTQHEIALLKAEPQTPLVVRELETLAKEERELSGELAAWRQNPFGAGNSYSLKHDIQKARVLKWPHHAWRPTSAMDRNILKAFLRAVRPDRIIVSIPENAPAATQSRLADIRQLVNDAMAEDGQLQIQVHTTGENSWQFRVQIEERFRKLCLTPGIAG